jgi:hypothetical protein
MRSAFGVANGRMGEWGESGRSGLSRHSGLSGRFVGGRLPVRRGCVAPSPFRPFAVSPILLR